MRSRTAIAALSLSILFVLSTGPARSQADDPAPIAFQALRVASSVPVTGSTSVGSLRSLVFDVPAVGSGPIQQATSFLQTYGAAFGLTGPEQRMLVRGRTPGPIQSGGPGEPGGTSPLQIVSFQQTYKDVPIFGGEIRVFVMNDPAAGSARIVSASGAVLPDFSTEGGLDRHPNVTPDACVAASQTFLGRPGQAPLADPRLMIFDARPFGGAPGPHLVWAATFAGGTTHQVLCDAHDGQIVFDRVFQARALDLELTRQRQIFPFNEEQMGDENGLNPTGQADAEAPSAWWYVGLVYNWFDALYGWKGTQGNDNGLKVRLDAIDSAGNASFNYNGFTEWIEVGDGWTSFDVLGHEFTHGIVHHTSGLVYQNVSGALDEGYSDTMGVAMDSQDWKLGEDRVCCMGNEIRNFDKPGRPRRSAVSGFTNNPQESNDYGDVHANSGVIAKANYLIATGEAFNGRPGFSTKAIGRSRMGTLAFFVLRTLPSSGNYDDARAISIAWAQIFASKGDYGFTSDAVCAVKDAFAAVEVGPGDFNCDGADDNTQDADGDFVPWPPDNCPNVWNPKQYDSDQDGIGNPCDNDADNDGQPDGFDNCPTVKNWDQANEDGDSMGDACDPDDDNDNVKDDGDNSGIIGDLPCLSLIVAGCDDNCRLKPNPSQFDGNNNGLGDACDPDTDGDGVYNSGAPGDICPQAYNPSQADSDSDGMGDACDLCPNVSDGAFTLDYNYDPPVPVPYQPDSDDDGIPDACDPDAFGTVMLDFNGAPYNPTQTFSPNGPAFQGMLAGPSGNQFRIPVALCDAAKNPGPTQVTEIVFTDLDPGVEVAIVDDDGLALGMIRPGPGGSNQRGILVTPDCARTYFLRFALGPIFPGADEFFVSSSFPALAGPSPWMTPGGGDPPPPPIPDMDGDGLPDSGDTCPGVFDPTGDDTEDDGVGDVCDNCPADFDPQQVDGDDDGAGDVCDCAPSNAFAFADPVAVRGLDVSEPAAGVLEITWIDQSMTAGPGTHYDVFSGAVGALRTNGDFSSGMCHTDDLPAPVFTYFGPDPPPNQAVYFMIRAQNDCPGGGAGTYGTVNRDTTAAQSPAHCN